MSKRRAAGDGSLLKWKKDGKVIGWIGVADLGDVDGKRKRQKVYGTTQGEVKARLDAILEKKRAGTLPRPGRLTVADWMSTWLKGLDVRPKTRETYELIARRHIVPGLGAKQLGKLTASDIDAFLEAKKGSLAPRSRYHIRTVLKTALKKAVRRRLIPYNVAAESDPVRVTDHEMQTLSAEQVEAFRAAVKGNRLEALYLLAVGLGLRQGELLGLRWIDIDLEASRLRVTRALQWIRATRGQAADATLVEPKSQSSRRTLPLPPAATAALRAHRVRWANEKLALGERYLNEWDLAFTGLLGEPLNPRTISDELDRILRDARLPDVRFHDLRHTALTLMRAQGVDIKVIQEFAGHRDVGLTLRVYSHVTTGLREQGVAAINAILGG
jgi:integrase